MTTPVTIRPATEDERSLVYDSWWKHNVSRCPSEVPLGEWRRRSQSAIIAVLDNSSVLVATPKDAHDDVIGTVCYKPTVWIHFVYTKYHVRRWGIARTLLDAATQGWERVRYTTKPRHRLRGLIKPDWKFDSHAGVQI